MDVDLPSGKTLRVVVSDEDFRKIGMAGHAPLVHTLKHMQKNIDVHDPIDVFYCTEFIANPTRVPHLIHEFI